MKLHDVQIGKGLTVGKLVDGLFRAAMVGTVRGMKAKRVGLPFLPVTPEIVEMALGAYEPWTTRILSQILRPGMHFLDIGAHVGYYTLLSGAIVGENGRVYAFEPEPKNSKALRENVASAGLRNVTIFSYAVGNQAGTAKLYVHPEGSGYHSLFPLIAEGLTEILIDVVRLDDLIRRGEVKRADVVKLDIQGAELTALRGAKRLLSEKHPVLLVEFCPSELRRAHTDPRELLQELRNLGYHLSAVDDLELKLFAVDDEVLLRHVGNSKYVNLLCKPRA
jgi:FkbM family methyltransferase